MISGIADPAARRRNPLIMILAYRTPLWRTTVSEVRQRYAGSAMGLFWVALAPALEATGREEDEAMVVTRSGWRLEDAGLPGRRNGADGPA